MTSKMNNIEPIAHDSAYPPHVVDFVYPLLQVWYYNSDSRKAVVVANSVDEAISLLARAFEVSVRDLDRSAVRMVNQYQRGVYIMNDRPTIH